MNTKKQKSLYITLAVVMFALIIFASRRDTTTDSSNNLTVDSALTITPEDWILGNRNAEVTLVEYSDFQCPACRAYTPIVEELSKLYKQNIRIVYRHFPLTTIHRNAFSASVAAESAGIQGKFWEMHDMLFDKQSDWSSSTDVENVFKTYAKELNLDMDKFTLDYNSETATNRVQANMDSGIKLKINSTPTFFLNGVKVENLTGLEAFRNLIDPLIGELDSQSINDTYLDNESDTETHFDLVIYLDNQLQRLQAVESNTNKYISFSSEKNDSLKLTKTSASLGYTLLKFGYSLENKCLIQNENTYCSADGKTLKLFINGVRNLDMENYIPQKNDRILISHGPLTDTNLSNQLSSVPKNACLYTNSCE